MMVIQGISRNEVNVTLSGMKKGRQRECIGFQWRRGGVWEKKGLTCCMNMMQSVYEQENIITNEVESWCECTNL